MTGKFWRGSFMLMMIGVLLTGFFRLPVYAADQEVLIEMNDTKLQMDVSTEMSLILRNVSGDVKLVSFEGLDNFEVLSNSQSSSTSIINGAASKEVKSNYTIMPKSVGTFTLQAVLSIDGVQYETNSVTVTVEEKDESLSGAKDDIFIRTTISGDSCYYGDNVVVTYELYSRYQVSEFGFTDSLTADGFIVEENSDQEYKPNYTTIDGNKYVMYTVKQLKLTPTMPGRYTLPAFDFQVNLSTGGFFGSTKATYLKTDEVSLTVKDLPAAGKPSQYGGLVGDLTIEGQLSSSAVNINEPITYNVTLSGKGNLYAIDSLVDYINLKDFSVYETVNDKPVQMDEDGVREEKEFEIILVAKMPGDLVIPEINIPYFDVTSGEYKELSLDSQKVYVEGSQVVDQPSEGSPVFDKNRSQPVVIDKTFAKVPEDIIVLKLSKSKLILIGGSIGGILLIFLIGILVFKNRDVLFGKSKTLLQEIRKINTDKEAYSFLEKYMADYYLVKLKSTAIEKAVSVMKDEEKAIVLRQLLYYFEEEHDSVPISLDEVKKKLEYLIN